MIRVRDTLIPIGSVKAVKLMYDHKNEVYYILVDADAPQMFMCPDRASGETELQQIQEEYIAIVKEYGD